MDIEIRRNGRTYINTFNRYMFIRSIPVYVKDEALALGAVTPYQYDEDFIFFKGLVYMEGEPLSVIS